MSGLKTSETVNKNRAMLNTTVDAEVFEKFKRTCKAQGMRMSTLLEVFMKQYSNGDFTLKFAKNDAKLDLD